MLKDYYGVSLTQVSAIVDYYEDYKSYIFQEPGDLEKYAYFINKADEYHDTVLAERDAMLKEMDSMGKPVYIIGDYGDMTVPVSEEAIMVGDTYTTLKKQTLGATGSTVSGTLSKSYIAAREAKGLGKYISPDKQVDASTCLFPDQTWIVKNLHHAVNVYALYAFMNQLVQYPGRATVDTFENYPQFMNSTSGDNPQLEPAQEHNANDVDWGAYDKEALDGTVSFLQKVIDFFADLIQKIYRVISGKWLVDKITGA